MKLSHGLTLFATLSVASATAWLGCSSSSSTPAASNDAGQTGNPDTGTTGNPDTGTTGNPDTGTTGNPDTGTTGNPDSGSDAGAVAQTCTAYCTAVQAACTGANQQYLTTQECMNACALFPAGAAADTTGNTLGCRIYHTALSASAPVPHCWHAGPYGFGACGKAADNFCSLAVGWCSPDAGFTGTAPYASVAACTTAVGAYALADGGTDSAAFNANGPGSGNTFDCREYHLGNALNSAQGGAGQLTHCPHAGQTSAPCQ